MIEIIIACSFGALMGLAAVGGMAVIVLAAGGLRP